MAIVNNAFFRVLNSVQDPTGSTEIAIGAEQGSIGGGAVDEQGTILENCNHLYSGLCLSVVWQCVSWGSGASQSALAEDSRAGAQTTFVEVLSGVFSVGAARDVSCSIDFQGQAQVAAYDLTTPTPTLLDSFTTSSSPSAQTLESDTLSLSGELEIRVAVSLKKTDTSDPALLYGVRLRELQGTL
ncbi:MAG: hypothetical protein CMJ75_22795 [Planctomycetaceae bacterium]|nr:hypothetical protein [Planctomycetaceae bacterium]